MNPRSFRYEQAGPVATLRLDRPEALNALTFDVYRELTDTFRAPGRPRRDVRAVVLTGTGRAFCTGGDVREIIGELLGRDAQALLEFTTPDLRPHPRHARAAAADRGLAERDRWRGRAPPSRWPPTSGSPPTPRASPSCSSRSGWRARTWARPTCSRGWSAWAAPPSC